VSLFAELKRRNVFRVGIAYVLMGWVVLQGADFALDLIDAPNWVIQALAVVVVAGLPIALFFAWAFELTPEGIKREHEVDRSQSIAPKTGRKLDFTIIGVLAVVIVFMGVERLFFAGGTEEPTAEQTSEVDLPAKTIAVLPFADLSQAQDQAWFADGLAEEILNALVRVPDLQVASRTSSFQFKGSSQDISAIALELGVAHVLEGSVRSSGDRIRVTAQLIRASDGFHLWSENYDRDLEDMITIQEDLASNIATALETTMDPAALAQMASVGTDSIEAYQEYLKGLQLQAAALAVSQGSEEFKQAYRHFETARTLDPNFAAAHVQAADYWRVELSPTRTDTGSSGLQPMEALREYHERIGLGIQTATNEADRVRSLADRAGVDLRMKEAVRLFEQYLELRPNDESARFELTNLLGMMSDREGVAENLAHWKEKGLTDQYSASGYINEAYRMADPSEAADFGLLILQRWPNATGLIYQTHRTLLWAGRSLEASQLAARYETLVPGGSPLMQAREACAAGDRAEAERILASLDSTMGNNLSSVWLIHNMLGNRHEEAESLRTLENTGVPYSLATFLNYHKFDPTPFPSIMAILEREGIDRPPPAVPPFRCPPPEENSIAVLPFVNMSSDPEQEYFSDGISEEILNALVKLDDLKVAGRTSSFAFKDKQEDLRAIGDALGVSHILEGSVRKSGDQVRITAQLIQVADGFHLWSETYTRELNDIFAVQDEISQAIVEQLEVALSDQERQDLARRMTENTEAYTKYLQGRQLWHQRGGTGLQAATEALREAVEMDPQFAEAWAALADAYVLLPEYVEPDVQKFIPLARDAVNRALELRPNMAQALTTRAYIRAMHDYDWDNAERDYLKAIELEPTYPTAHQWYGEMLTVTRDYEGAMNSLRRASDLDPLAPVMWHVKGWIALNNEKPEEALGYYQRALEIFPGFETTWAVLPRVYMQLGDFDQARQSWRRFMELTGIQLENPYFFINAVEDPTRRPVVLEFMANATSEQWTNGAINKAYDYMLLDEPELAMDSMEEGLEYGDPFAVYANMIYLYDELRDNPRFQAHLAKMNLWP
jgi:TolB-like protein/two-component SAPR family response regulator